MHEAMVSQFDLGMGSGNSHSPCCFASRLGNPVIERMDINTAVKSQAADLATARSELISGDIIGIYHLSVKKAKYYDKAAKRQTEGMTLVSPDFNNEPIQNWTDDGTAGMGDIEEWNGVNKRARQLADTPGNAAMFWVSPGKEDSVLAAPHRAYFWLKKGNEVTAYSYSLAGTISELSGLMVNLGGEDKGVSSLPKQTLVLTGEDVSQIDHRAIYDAYVASVKPDTVNKQFLKRFKKETEIPDVVRESKLRDNTRHYQSILEKHQVDLAKAVESIVHAWLKAVLWVPLHPVNETRYADKNKRPLWCSDSVINGKQTKKRTKENARISSVKITEPVFRQNAFIKRKKVRIFNNVIPKEAKHDRLKNKRTNSQFIEAKRDKIIIDNQLGAIITCVKNYKKNVVLEEKEKKYLAEVKKADGNLGAVLDAFAKPVFKQPDTADIKSINIFPEKKDNTIAILFKKLVNRYINLIGHEKNTGNKQVVLLKEYRLIKSIMALVFPKEKKLATIPEPDEFLTAVITVVVSIFVGLISEKHFIDSNSVNPEMTITPEIAKMLAESRKTEDKYILFVFILLYVFLYLSYGTNERLFTFFNQIKTVQLFKKKVKTSKITASGLIYQYYCK